MEEALKILAAEGIIAMPTETVYGLAGDATSDIACTQIFETKNRPSFNPLIAHMADLAMAEQYVIFSPIAEMLAQKFWPGPLTLVLPKKDKCTLSDLTSAGQPTQAVRVPHHPVALDLLKQFGKPLAAPSANRSGHISPTQAAHVRASLGEMTPYILDAGPCRVGVESTILKIAQGRVTLLREGGINAEAIETAIGARLILANHTANHTIEAPGMMRSHYAPNGTVRINAKKAHDDEVLLGFGEIAGDVTLSEKGDLAEAASNLFRLLYELDMQNKNIAVAPIPDEGLGRAINDRLRRAAAPRENEPVTRL